jgi:hypothetical protein
MHPTKLRFIWPSGFREDLEIDQSETRISSTEPLVYIEVPFKAGLTNFHKW